MLMGTQKSSQKRVLNYRNLFIVNLITYSVIVFTSFYEGSFPFGWYVINVGYYTELIFLPAVSLFTFIALLRFKPKKSPQANKQTVYKRIGIGISCCSLLYWIIVVPLLNNFLSFLWFLPYYDSVNK